MLKISGYVKTFKVKDQDKEKNNKLMSFRIDYVRSSQKSINLFGIKFKTQKIFS